jgi:release factor glutamine methyltransferase
MKVRTNLLKDVKTHYHRELTGLYGKEEALSLLNLLIQHFFGLSRVDQALHNDFRLTETELLKFHFAVKELKKEKPVQYIVGETYFYGLPIKVNPSVLIPRPETEQLTELIIEKNKNRNGLRVLDIGTGSGCIALALKKFLPESKITALDISQQALETAKLNSEINGLSINFVQSDILDKKSMESMEIFDLIVSNPPYVTETDKNRMKKNVTDYEPSTALFVKNDDPLIFYHAIADFALQKLNDQGQLWFEINELFGNKIHQLLVKKGFRNINVRKDLFGKDRFVSCMK